MARFGSFGAGLAAGVESGLDRLDRQHTAEYQGMTDRHRMSQQGLTQLMNVALKYKEAGKQIPPEIQEMLNVLAKQTDRYSTYMGLGDAGMHEATTQALAGLPVTSKDQEGYMLQHRDTKEIKHFKTLGDRDAFLYGSGALVGDEDSGVYPADPNEQFEDKGKWLSVKPGTADMEDPVQPKPTRMWVSLLDENGKLTGERRKITDEEYDPNLHTDLKLQADSLPSLRTKIIKTDDGRLAEQKEQLTNGEYVAYGVAKPIEDLPYTYTPLENRKGHYLRVNPNTDERVIVDLSDLSAQQQAEMTAAQLRADATAGVSTLRGQAQATQQTAEFEALVDKNYFRNEGIQNARADHAKLVEAKVLGMPMLEAMQRAESEVNESLRKAEYLRSKGQEVSDTQQLIADGVLADTSKPDIRSVAQILAGVEAGIPYDVMQNIYNGTLGVNDTVKIGGKDKTVKDIVKEWRAKMVGDALLDFLISLGGGVGQPPVNQTGTATGSTRVSD
tara:strand:- start:356 stop:1858 length:1503 start_codon:yes stop_codon:yes gene_type:complete